MENTLNCPKVTCTYKKITVKKFSANYKDPDYKDRKVIRFSQDAYENFKTVFEGFVQHHEEFWVMFLSRGNKVLGMSCIGIGGLDGTVVDIRMIFQMALLANANSIIIAHNHPSGTLATSTHDEIVTKKIAEAGKIMDIRLNDHIILTADSYFSFSDEGLLR